MHFSTGPRLTIFLQWTVCPPKIWVNFSTILIRSRVLIFESYYSATDAEFGIPNNEFKLQIPLLGYYLDAKSNLVHITIIDTTLNILVVKRWTSSSPHCIVVVAVTWGRCQWVLSWLTSLNILFVMPCIVLYWTSPNLWYAMSCIAF